MVNAMKLIYIINATFISGPFETINFQLILKDISGTFVKNLLNRARVLNFYRNREERNARYL